MFTSVIELGLDKDSKALLQSYSDYFVDRSTAVVDNDGKAS